MYAVLLKFHDRESFIELKNNKRDFQQHFVQIKYFCVISNVVQSYVVFSDTSEDILFSNGLKFLLLTCLKCRNKLLAKIARNCQIMQAVKIKPAHFKPYICRVCSDLAGGFSNIYKFSIKLPIMLTRKKNCKKKDVIGFSVTVENIFRDESFPLINRFPIFSQSNIGI